MASTDTAAPMIRLRHPQYAGLSFGADPDSAIQFGHRAGQAEGEAWIPEDHPLLPALLEAHPEIVIVTASGPTIMWACPFHPNSTFKTKGAMLSHMRGQGHDADALASLAEPSPAATVDGRTTSPSSNVTGEAVPVPPAQPPKFGG